MTVIWLTHATADCRTSSAVTKSISSREATHTFPLACPHQVVRSQAWRITGLVATAGVAGEAALATG
jgi:hypothetical protein